MSEYKLAYSIVLEVLNFFFFFFFFFSGCAAQVSGHNPQKLLKIIMAEKISIFRDFL